MKALAIISTPEDQTAAVREWLINAAKGLRKRIASIDELNEARDAAAYALRGERLWDRSVLVGASNNRRLRRIRVRTFEIVETAIHINELKVIGFLLGADADERMAVRQREPKSGAGTIAHLSTAGGVRQ